MIRYWSSPISFGTGFCLGSGLIFSLNAPSWPEVNYGQFLVLISAFLAVSIVPINRSLQDFSSRQFASSLVLGILASLLYKGGSTQILGLAISLIGLTAKFLTNHDQITQRDYSVFIGASSLCVSLLSMVADGVEPTSLASTIISLYLVSQLLDSKISANLLGAVMLSCSLGLWSFREINGNIEFIGANALFILVLSVSSIIALIFPIFENSEASPNGSLNQS